MQSVVAELYRVFKPYRLGDDFSGCDHCVSAADSKRLASIPLRELSVSDVDRYAFKAMTTWGTDRHFKHFLPRLLELAMDDYLAFDFPEVLLGKLAYGHWTTWPATERDAVRQYLDSFWEHQLHTPGNFPTDERIQTVLGGLAEACDSIGPYLEAWSNHRSEIPVFHLGQLINDAEDDIMTTGTVSLWGEPSTQCMELVGWLTSATPFDILNSFRDTISEVFPLASAQCDRIRAATSTEKSHRTNR